MKDSDYVMCMTMLCVAQRMKELSEERINVLF